jgi:hypothetical protein
MPRPTMPAFALLLAVLVLAATSSAVPCGDGRNTQIQSVNCTCGANADPTLDVCEKDHYCHSTKTSGSRCSARPFDKCMDTSGETENPTDCKCDSSNTIRPPCTAATGRFCNSDNTYGKNKHACLKSSPNEEKDEKDATDTSFVDPRSGPLQPLEHVGKCTSSDPCTACQGNCVTEKDCRGALQCYRTEILRAEGDKLIPGCETKGMKEWYGYCYCNSNDVPCWVAPSPSLSGGKGKPMKLIKQIMNHSSILLNVLNF